jgi:hypothetical protein
MFPVPSDDRLEAFLQFVEQTDKSKLATSELLNHFRELKSVLMNKN